MADHSLAVRLSGSWSTKPVRDHENRLYQYARATPELGMSDLFDVSKEIILVSGASRTESDLDSAIMLLAASALRYMTDSMVTVDGGFLLI
jgi:hypothetical protein